VVVPDIEEDLVRVLDVLSCREDPRQMHGGGNVSGHGHAQGAGFLDYRVVGIRRNPVVDLEQVVSGVVLLTDELTGFGR
jgi:hypothetical protein